MFFAGGAVSEEKQKDAGHFDPGHHSHCSNYYSFWNKVLVLHSSGVCFLCGCMVCICLDLDLVFNEADCLSYPPGHDKRNSVSPCRCTCGNVEIFFVVHFNERNNQKSV